MLLLFIEAVSAFCGVILIYLALFTYEDEQKQLQNSLETFWIRIDSLKTDDSTRRMILLRGIASLSTAILDRLFGKSLISFRSVIMTSLLMVGAMDMFLEIYLFPHGHPGGTKINHDFKDMLPLLVGILPLIWPNKWVVRLVCSFGVLMLGTLLFVIIYAHQTNPQPSQLIGSDIYIAASAAAILTVLPFVAFSRKALKSSSEYGSTRSIIIVAVGNLLVAIIFISPLLMDSFELYPKWTDELYYGPGIWLALQGFAFANCLTIFIALLIFGMIGIVFAHKMIWPALARIMYALQRFRIATKPVVLVPLGLFFLSGILPKPLYDLLSKVLPKLF